RPPTGPAVQGRRCPPERSALARAGALASFSGAPVVRLHRQFGLGVGGPFRRDREKLAAAILNRGVLELVVLALVVELDAGADGDIGGDMGGGDGVGGRLRLGRARTLVGIRRN